jgi:hypothetical protein
MSGSMWKEDILIDTIFDPFKFSLDSIFNERQTWNTNDEHMLKILP